MIVEAGARKGAPTVRFVTMMTIAKVVVAMTQTLTAQGFVPHVLMVKKTVWRRALTVEEHVQMPAHWAVIAGFRMIVSAVDATL